MMQLDFSALTPYMHRLDAVFSDVDGTLLDNEPLALDDIGEACGRYIKACKHPYIDPHIKQHGFGNIRTLAGNSPIIIRDILGKRATIQDDFPVTLPYWLDTEFKRLRAIFPGPNDIIPCISPIVEFMEFADALGLPVRAVTSSDRPRAERHLRNPGKEILSKLSRNLISADTDLGPKLHKPHPDVYEMALKRVGAEASRSLTFEDSFNGCEAAVGAKIPVIGVLLGGHIPENEKKERAELMLQAGAAGIIRHASDFMPVMHEVLSRFEKRPSLRLVVGGQSPTFNL